MLSEYRLANYAEWYVIEAIWQSDKERCDFPANASRLKMDAVSGLLRFKAWLGKILVACASFDAKSSVLRLLELLPPLSASIKSIGMCLK